MSPRPRTRLPDPARHFTDVPGRRVPQLEFGSRVSCFRLYHETDVTLTSTGAEIDLEWECWEQGDDRIFEPRTAGGASPVLGSTNTRSVRLLVPGIYLFSASLDISTNGLAGSRTIVLNDGLDSPQAQSHPRHAGAGADYIFEKTNSYPTNRCGSPSDLGSPPYAQVSLDAAQSSGADEDISRMWWEIYYLGLYSLEEFNG